MKAAPAMPMVAMLFVVLALCQSATALLVFVETDSKECERGESVTYNVTISHADVYTDNAVRIDVLLIPVQDEGEVDISPTDNFTLVVSEQATVTLKVTVPNDYTRSTLQTVLEIWIKDSDMPDSQYHLVRNPAFLTVVTNPENEEDDETKITVKTYNPAIIAAAASGLTIIAFIIADRKGWLVGMSIPLFTRLTPKTVLRNDARQKIYTLLQTAEDEAMFPGEISLELDIPRSTIRHHLLQLRNQSMICRHGDGSYAIRYIPGRKDPNSRKIFEMYFYDKLSQSEIARRLKISRQAVSDHLKRHREEYSKTGKAS